MECSSSSPSTIVVWFLSDFSLSPSQALICYPHSTSLPHTAPAPPHYSTLPLISPLLSYTCLTPKFPLNCI